MSDTTCCTNPWSGARPANNLLLLFGAGLSAFFASALLPSLFTNIDPESTVFITGAFFSKYFSFFSLYLTQNNLIPFSIFSFLFLFSFFSFLVLDVTFGVDFCRFFGVFGGGRGVGGVGFFVFSLRCIVLAVFLSTFSDFSGVGGVISISGCSSCLF